MKTIDLCPACLTELPEGYPFDHVAVDQALGKRPELIAGMSGDERLEVVLTGLARDISINQMAVRFGWDNAGVRRLLPAEHPESAESLRGRAADERRVLEDSVRVGWAEGLSDLAIALRLGRNASSIGRVRRDIGLPTLHGPGGRTRKQAVPA